MAKHAVVDGAVSAVSGSAPGGDQRQRTPGTGPKHAVSLRVRMRRVVVLTVLAGLAGTAFLIVSRLSSATPDRSAPEAPSTSAGPGETLGTNPGRSLSDTPAALVQSAGPPAQSPTVGSLPDQLLGSPPGPLPQSGPGITQPGTLMVASPASDGSFDVLERIRLVGPVTMLMLRPAPVSAAGRVFASASAAATQVQVSAGDQPVDVPGAEVGAAMGLPVASVDHFQLRYRLTDVTVISTPSTAGRALAAIGPLNSMTDDLPVLFFVTGDTVLGLNCPLLPLSQQSCGSRVQAGPSIEHELPWPLALTSVQFDLPPA